MIFKHFQKTLDHPGGKKEEKIVMVIFGISVSKGISAHGPGKCEQNVSRGQPNIAGATIVLYCATWHYLS